MAEPERVFISYSNEDADLVKRLKTALAKAGVDVWLDHEQLTPGTRNWQIKVREGIAQATYMVYAASETAALSDYVHDEINIARDKGKTVIPFWLRGTFWHDCAPLGFGATQYIDGRAAAYAAGLAKLLTALGAIAVLNIPIHFLSCITQIRRAEQRSVIEVLAYRDQFVGYGTKKKGQIVYSRQIALNHPENRGRDELDTSDGLREELEQNGWRCIAIYGGYPVFNNRINGTWRSGEFQRQVGELSSGDVGDAGEAGEADEIPF